MTSTGGVNDTVLKPFTMLNGPRSAITKKLPNGLDTGRMTFSFMALVHPAAGACSHRTVAVVNAPAVVAGCEKSTVVNGTPAASTNAAAPRGERYPTS